MRKHNRKFATRWGSERVQTGTAHMAHNITNSKSFQLAAMFLMHRLFKKAGL